MNAGKGYLRRLHLNFLRCLHAPRLCGDGRLARRHAGHLSVIHCCNSGIGRRPGNAVISSIRRAYGSAEADAAAHRHRGISGNGNAFHLFLSFGNTHGYGSGITAVAGLHRDGGVSRSFEGNMAVAVNLCHASIIRRKAYALIRRVVRTDRYADISAFSNLAAQTGRTGGNACDRNRLRRGFFGRLCIRFRRRICGFRRLRLCQGLNL